MVNRSNAELIEDMRWQLDKIRDRQDANARLLTALDSVRDQLGALEVRVTSPDGTVTVVAGTGGIIRSVELAPHAVSGNSATLAAALNATIRQATGEAHRRQVELCRAAVGDDVDVTQLLGRQATITDHPGPNTDPARSEGGAFHHTGYDEEEVSIYDTGR